MFSFLLICLGVVCLLITLLSCMARAPVPPRHSQAGRDQNPPWVLPVLVLMVGGLLAFGLLWFLSYSGARSEGQWARTPAPRTAVVVDERPAQPVVVRDPAPEQPAAAAEADPESSWTVHGTGLSSAEAEQDALEKAQAQVIAYLRQQKPPLEWAPPLDYVRKQLVKSKKDEGFKEFPDVGRVYRVSERVEITPEARVDLLRKDRDFRKQQRMLLLSDILAAVLVLLVGITTYVRVDEWTKGYYKNWLRLAVVGFVVACGAGLYLLIRA